MSGCGVMASEKRLPDKTASKTLRKAHANFGLLALDASPWSASTKDMPALMLMESCRVRTTSSFKGTLPLGGTFGSTFRPRWSNVFSRSWNDVCATGVDGSAVAAEARRGAAAGAGATSSARQETRKNPFPLSNLARSDLFSASITPREDSPLGLDAM